MESIRANKPVIPTYNHKKLLLFAGQFGQQSVSERSEKYNVVVPDAGAKNNFGVLR